MNIPLVKMALPQSTLDEATRLLGFDYGDGFYHVLAFDFGDDGGAIGVWREGDNFCARITLDALAEFNTQAKESACVGFPSCDGDLVGEDHSALCHAIAQEPTAQEQK